MSCRRCSLKSLIDERAVRRKRHCGRETPPKGEGANWAPCCEIWCGMSCRYFVDYAALGCDDIRLRCTQLLSRRQSCAHMAIMWTTAVDQDYRTISIQFQRPFKTSTSQTAIYEPNWFFYKIAFKSKAGPTANRGVVTSSHVTNWRSHHSIRSSRKPHAARKHHGSMCSIEWELLPIRVLHCGNMNFRPFGSCDLDLDPITFIYDLRPYSLQIYRMRECELHIKAFESYRLTEIHTDYSYTERQTDRLWTGPKLYTLTLLRGWSKILITRLVFNRKILTSSKRSRLSCEWCDE